MMKNRFFIAVIIVLMGAGLLFLARFVKRDVVSVDRESGTRGQRSGTANIESYLKEAQAFQERGSLLEAREIYQRLMDMSLSSEQLSMVQNKQESLNISILFSGISIEGSKIYEVVKGDTLSKIAKQFHTTIDSIKRASNIRGTVIHPGMKLRILDGVFSIFVDKSQNILILKYNNEVVKTYTVSTGSNNSTPVGTFKIKTKLIDPVWYRHGKAIPSTSPENILGSRWLGFDLPTYGIHGTIAPEDIGKQITEGCVRMRNEDVEELYGLVPVGVEVVIAD